MLRALLYFNKSAYPSDFFLHSLRLMHNCFKSAEDFRTLFLEKHGFTLKNLDLIVSDTLSLFKENLATNTPAEQDGFINACSIISALVDCFPERSQEFGEIIVPLIAIIKEKIDAVRKTAAVCLAKISKDEENAKIMRANHGTEVLVSLSNVLVTK